MICSLLGRSPESRIYGGPEKWTGELAMDNQGMLKEENKRWNPQKCRNEYLETFAVINREKKMAQFEN